MSAKRRGKAARHDYGEFDPRPVLVNPPASAAWLLSLADPHSIKEALVGDLFEEYQHHRSPRWFWKQALKAIGIALLRDMREHWAMALRVLTIGFLLMVPSHNQLANRVPFSWLVAHVGLVPSALVAGAPETFLTFAPAGLLIALMHRKRQLMAVAVYTMGLAVFGAYIVCTASFHRMTFVLLNLEYAILMVVSGLSSGLLGCLLSHRPSRMPRWIPADTPR